MRIYSLKSITRFFYRALRQSTVFKIFGQAGIKSSLLYRLICVPYVLCDKIEKKHGARISTLFENSAAAKYINFDKALIIQAAAAPFCAESLYFTGSYLLLCYFLKGFRIKGFISLPTAADALIFLSALFYFTLFSGFSFYALLALFCYRAVVSGTRENKRRVYVSAVFIISSAAAAIFGVFSSDTMSTEFYILMIPFCFSAARIMPPPYKEISFGLGGLLVLIFFSVISGGSITPAATFLCIYLCLRDLRFFVPIIAVIAAVFGLFSDVINSAAGYGGIFLSGAAALVLSQIFYINLPRGTRKKAFVRSVTAAICGTSAAFVSGGGGSRLGFVFWMVVALSFPSEKRFINEKI